MYHACSSCRRSTLSLNTELYGGIIISLICFVEKSTVFQENVPPDSVREPSKRLTKVGTVTNNKHA